MTALVVAFMVVLGSRHCHSVSFPSNFIVDEPNSDRDAALGISLLHCKWNSQLAGLEWCTDNNTIGYGGVANFDVAAVALNPADSSELRLPFVDRYSSAPPVCTFQLEGQEYKTYLFLTRLSSERDYVRVFLFSVTGYRMPWTFVTTQISIICYGPITRGTVKTPETGAHDIKV